MVIIQLIILLKIMIIIMMKVMNMDPPELVDALMDPMMMAMGGALGKYNYFLPFVYKLTTRKNLYYREGQSTIH